MSKEEFLDNSTPIMESGEVHFTIGDDFGIYITQISQEQLLMELAPIKALRTLTNSLQGMSGTRNYERRVRESLMKTSRNMEDQYTITKSTVDCYKMRHKSGMYWADIVLDCNKNAGRIQIASDYGSWENYWNSCGCSFKEFLTKLDIGYTAGKFCEDRWFDEEATKRSIYNDIKYRREIRDLTADQAKELIDECQELDFSSKEAYQFSFFNSNLLCKEFDSCDIPFETSISPQFRRFWNEPWKAFIEQIKQEISQTTV